MLSEYKDRIIDFAIKHKKRIKIIALVLLVGGMSFKGAMQFPQIRAAKAEIARLNGQIEYEKKRQEEVLELKNKVNSDEYIEKIASERLGLVKSNAKIFVDVSGEQQ